jgi:hypothetical protein
MSPSYSFMDLMFLLPIMFIPTVLWLAFLFATGGRSLRRLRPGAEERAASAGVAGMFTGSRDNAVDDNDPDAFRAY